MLAASGDVNCTICRFWNRLFVTVWIQSLVVDVECYTCYWCYWCILSEPFTFITGNGNTDNLCIGYGWNVYNVNNFELESYFEFYIDANMINTLDLSGNRSERNLGTSTSKMLKVYYASPYACIL